MIIVTVLYLGMNDGNQEQIMYAQTTLNRFKKYDHNKVGYHNYDEDDDYKQNNDEGSYDDYDNYADSISIWK